MTDNSSDPAAPGRLTAEVVKSLELTEVGPDTWQAAHLEHGRGVAFGGTLLGQAILAATTAQPGKNVKSVQTIFARPIRVDTPADISARTLHSGRNLGSVAIDFSQQGKIGASMLVLLETPEPDLVRYQGPSAPEVAPPDPAAAANHALAAPETIIVGDVDIVACDQTGPASLQLWVRFPQADTDDALHRALLAHCTDGWLIATAMRPHEGLGQEMAHVEVSTGVVSHALSFHGEVDASAWLLIDHTTTFSGGGRTYGQGHVFTEGGELVASFVQEALLRHFPEGQNPAGKKATVF